jgi:hypothetical protein
MRVRQELMHPALVGPPGQRLDRPAEGGDLGLVGGALP